MPGIIRVEHRRRNPYVVIDRRPLEDPRLGWAARGPLGYLLAKPDDWQLRVSDLCRRGDLGREVLVPLELSSRLEALRHRDPVTIRDRGIVYQQHYDLGGGNAWGKSFGKASARALGWSHGAHGLRHSYAQERMAELQARGFDYVAAREIVSQELGHFRGDVVEVYCALTRR